MADIVLPRVRLIFACDEAVLDPTDMKWIVKHPATVRFLPPGSTFPFRERNFWVYAQLAGGLGTMELAIEMRRRRDDGSYRSVGTGAAVRLEFSKDESRLVVLDTAFGFEKLPFRSEGIYNFRVVARTGEGYAALNGMTAELTMLDPAGRP